MTAPTIAVVARETPSVAVSAASPSIRRTWASTTGNWEDQDRTWATVETITVLQRASTFSPTVNVVAQLHSNTTDLIAFDEE